MRCLVVEDDPAICFLIEQAVAHVGCESLVAATLADGLRLACADGAPELAVVAHVPHGADAVAWCEALRSGESGRPCHVVVLASTDDTFDLRRVTAAGIDDVLVKPFQAIELELRLRNASHLIHAREDLDAADLARRTTAMRDPVTRVLAPGAIADLVRQEWARAGRDLTSLSVLAMEVDNLSSVVEWHGAEMANVVLAEVAARIRKVLRTYDGLGRSGDAGFLATLPRCEAAVAAAVAERVRVLVAALPVEALGRVASVTVSMGVGRLGPGHESRAGDGDRADRLVSDTVALASRIRATGGNRVETL